MVTIWEKQNTLKRGKEMTKHARNLFIYLLVAMGILGACANSTEDTGTSSNKQSAAKENQIHIVTTFYPMYEFTQKIVGEAATVTMMVPAGTDTHHYEPSAKQIGVLNEADVFVYATDQMETWVPDVLNTLDPSSSPVVIEAAEDISLLSHEEEEHVEEGSHDGHAHEEDPHVWLDPVLAQVQVQTIMASLQKADPKNKDVYEENGQAYIEELKTLDQEFEEAFEGATFRSFVTEHAAFGYLAHRYDLTQLSIAGLSTENEPSPVQLAKLDQLINEQNIEVIYRNSDSSTNIADTLAQETGIEVDILHSLESVTEKDIEAGADYLSLMRNNIDALKRSIHK